MTKKDRVTKEMTINEVVMKYPKAIEVFFRHGLFCVGCRVAEVETVEEGAIVHGIDVDALMEDLKKVVSET